MSEILLPFEIILQIQMEITYVNIHNGSQVKHTLSKGTNESVNCVLKGERGLAD